MIKRMDDNVVVRFGYLCRRLFYKSMFDNPMSKKHFKRKSNNERLWNKHFYFLKQDLDLDGLNHREQLDVIMKQLRELLSDNPDCLEVIEASYKQIKDEETDGDESPG